MTNHIKNFYNGNLSLLISYWLVGIVGSIIIFIFALYIDSKIIQNNVSIYLVLLPWQCFISLGIWRASNKYQGPKILALFAKIAVIFGWLNIVFAYLAFPHLSLIINYLG